MTLISPLLPPALVDILNSCHWYGAYPIPVPPPYPVIPDQFIRHMYASVLRSPWHWLCSQLHVGLCNRTGSTTLPRGSTGPFENQTKVTWSCTNSDQPRHRREPTEEDATKGTPCSIISRTSLRRLRWHSVQQLIAALEEAESLGCVKLGARRKARCLDFDLTRDKSPGASFALPEGRS